LRVYVWRQLRRLGALYLQKSVCLLPNRPEVRAALQPILLRVRAQGGTVRNLTIQVEGSDHDALVAEQRSERDLCQLVRPTAVARDHWLPLRGM
jgi:hypothetical protein